MYYKKCGPLGHYVIAGVLLLGVAADAIELYQEQGYRTNTHFYHTGPNSHAYYVNVETKSSIYFKCVFYDKLKCHGRAILRVGGAFRISNNHNHPPDRDYVGQRHFRENVLNRVREGRYLGFSDILESERLNRRYARRVRRVMTMRRLRNPMQRARMESFPACPESLRDLTHLLLQEEWRNKISCTVDKDDNLYCGSTTASDGSHHVAFISRRMREFTSKISILQSDGTFRSRPLVPHSAQVFVLVTPWRNVSVPIGWILMERRTLAAYRAVFQLLKEVCPVLMPDVIVSDWEYPQQKAWQEAFPGATIQGCLWHLCRAFIRKAGKLRLLRFRDALPPLMLLIRKTCAIGLLPTRYFLVGLGIIKREARDEEDDGLLSYLLEPFFNYVEQKWIRNNTRRAYMTLFNSMHRTNNVCESHNKVLRKAVGAYRPNIYAFIDALARIEHTTSLNVEALAKGDAVSRARRWQSVYTDRALTALCNDLRLDVARARNETIKQFLDRACNLFISAYNSHVRHWAARAVN